MEFPALTAQSAVLEALRSKHVIWILATVPLGVVLAGEMYRERLSEVQRRWVRGLAYLLIFAFSVIDIAIVASNVRNPRDWDFNHFWVWGNAVVEGTSPYDHANLLRIAEPINPSQELKDELYGFYPPPSLLLFAPLGWLPYKPALVAWNMFQALALVACLRLFVQIFLSENSGQRGAPLMAIVLCYWATSATFAFSQTNFLVLLASLLFWRDRDKPVAGIWIALGMLVKPLAAALALYLLVRGQRRGLVMFAVGLLVLTGITWLVLGQQVFKDFVQREGISEQYVLAQDVNQSLTGVLLRAKGDGSEAKATSIFDFPLILIAIAIVIAVTARVIWRASGAGDAYTVGMTFAMMLMIYPATLTHYGVLLLPPMALLFTGHQGPSRRRGRALAVILVVFLLSAFKFTFWAFLLTWVIMMVEALTGNTSPSEKASALDADDLASRTGWD